MMVSVIHVAVQGHVMSLVCASAISHVDVCGLCYLLKSCWCPWLMLPLVMLLSVACAATEGHDGCLCSMLLLRAMLFMIVICATTVNYMEADDPLLCEL